MEIKIPWCACPKGFWQHLGCSNLCICFPSCPLTFPGAPWKGDAFNDLHLTRLEINLLVNLSHSTCNDRSGGDVTFLVGEHIKGACLQRAPWTPKGTSGCQVSLDPTGEGERGRKQEQAHWIPRTNGRYFNPLLLPSYTFHHAWLFIFRWKREKQDKRQRLLFLTAKPPNAGTHEHGTSSPYTLHLDLSASSSQNDHV